jgi:hypothetical protein
MSPDEVMSDEFMRIALRGFTIVGVEASSPWAYTIGLMQSFNHPELVVTGPSLERAGHLLGAVSGRVRDGERFTATSPPQSVCKCSTVAFGAVHRGQWEQGRFDWWFQYYAWAGGSPRAEPEAIQVLWPDEEDRFPPDPEFCIPHGGQCQPLLDREPRHNVNTGSDRTQRRRRRYGHGKRPRRS